MVVNTDNTPENNVETSKGFTLEGLSNQVTKVSEQVSEVSNEVTNVKNQARALEEDVATLSTKKQAEQVSADVIGNIENGVQNAETAPLWTNYEGFIKSVDELENEYRRMKYAIQGTKTTKAGRESLDNTKKKLKDWSSVLDKLGKNKERYNKRAEKRDKKHPEYAENVPEIQVEDLANFLAAYRQLEPLKRDISNIQSGKFSEEAQFPNNSIEQVKRSIKENRKYYKKQLELNKALQDATIIDIYNDEGELKRKLLTDILEGRMDEKHKEYYDQIFRSLGQNIANYPFLSAGMLACKGIKVNHKGRIENNQNIGSVSPVIATVPGAVVYGNTPTRPSTYENLEWGETFNAGGLKGMLRKCFDYFPNLTNSQKDGWSSLIYTGGLIFGAVKGVQRLFKGKGKWRQKGLGIGGAVLGSQIVFGKDPITLISQVLNGGFSWDQIKRRAGNSFSLLQKEKPEQYQWTIDQGLATVVRPTTTLRNFSKQINDREKGKEDPSSWNNFYQSTLQTLSGKNDVKPVAEAFKQLGPDFDYNKFKAFMDRIGVGLPIIHEHLQDKTMKEIVSIGAKNLEKLNLASKNYKVKEDKLDEINKFLLKEGFNPETIFTTLLDEGLIEPIDATTVAPEREKKDKGAFAEKMEELGLDEKKTKFLIDGFNGMYNEMKADTKPQFDIIPDDGDLYLVNKGIKVLINLDNKTIPGFRNNTGSNSQEIQFESAKDLLRTAYSAAAIIKAFENKPTSNEQPFQHKGLGKGIYFDDKTFWSRGLDTRALSTWRNGSSWEISPQVGSHPAQFADYLNTLWKESGGQPNTNESAPNVSFENLGDRGNTKSQVEQLSLSDNNKVETQKTLNRIWADMSLPERTLGSLSISETAFGSYGQTTEINLKHRFITDLSTKEGEKIYFSTTKELLETVHFLNLMKYKTKDMEPYYESGKTYPFHIDLGKICFMKEGKKREVLSGNITGLITNIFNSSIIQKNKSDIVDYLNDWRSSL